MDNLVVERRLTMVKKHLNIIPVILLLLHIFAVPAPAQVKLGQTGFQFLSVVSDARAGALGTAMTTLPGGSSSLFFNPANMARSEFTLDATASQNSWFADIQHTTFSAAFQPAQGRFGVIGLSYIGVDYGEFQGTMVWNNNKGYIDTETFQPSAYALGVGYAIRLSDRFSIGGQVKYADQYLGRSVVFREEEAGEGEVTKNLAGGLAYDFGTVYRTEFRSLNFGMSIRNFSRELTYVRESFQLPLMFRIGLSMDAFQMTGISLPHQSMLLTFDAVHPRSYPEYVNLGLEYTAFDVLNLRTGYTVNRDLEDVTVGFGISKFGVSFDYAYTPFGVFDAVQRFTVRLRM